MFQRFYMWLLGFQRCPYGGRIRDEQCCGGYCRLTEKNEKAR